MYEEIAKHYIEKIIPSEDYFSNKSVRNTNLLFPEFLEKVNIATESFQNIYSNVKVFITETYRSNELQLLYFKNKASKIKVNGMHHYGIACDQCFMIEDRVTYKGDFKTLRKCLTEAGLFVLGSWDIGHTQFISSSFKDQNLLRNTVKEFLLEFQFMNDLKVDGIVGKYTIAKAKELYVK